MKNLKEELINAKENNFAIPAFNIFNYVSASAVIKAGEKHQVPVIIQTSVGTVKYYGARVLQEMLQGLKKNASTNVYLHLDHCTSVEFSKECIDSGWDSVMFDGSKFSLKENIEMTKEVVAYAHPKGVTVEGELGTIVGVEEEIKVDKAQLASKDDCLIYVKESGVDYFAPAIGTAHGIYVGEPHLNYELVTQLSETIAEPIVIHGGSGLTEEMFRELVRRGSAKINISTAIKHAYFDGIRKYQEENPGKISPLDMDESMYQSIKEVAEYHISLFRI